MRTPAGTECPYFYADYFRGREMQECRLIDTESSDDVWEEKICARCPVPGIVRANGCRSMSLHARIKSGLLGFGRKVVVTAYCSRAGKTVGEPHIGCGHCHEDLPEFTIAPEE